MANNREIQFKYNFLYVLFPSTMICAMIQKIFSHYILQEGISNDL